MPSGCLVSPQRDYQKPYRDPWAIRLTDREALGKSKIIKENCRREGNGEVNNEIEQSWPL